MPWPTFAKKEDIPAAFADQYEERDGKWLAKEDGAGSGLQSALDKERTARKTAETAKKAADEARLKAEAEAEELRTNSEATKVGVKSEELKALREKIRKDVLGEMQTTIAEKDASIAQLQGHAKENRTLKLDNAVKKAMLDNGVRGDRVDALFRLAADEFDLTEDGKPTLKNHPGKVIDVYVKDDLKKSYPEFYNGTQAAGGGAAGAHGGSPQAGTTFEDLMKNPGAAIAAARAAGATR